MGNGIVEAGIVSCTLGTSGVVFAHMEKVAYDPAGRVHTFCHAVRDKWHVMGVTQGAGLSLQWFRNRLAPGADYDALMAEAAQSPAGAHGLFWLPYLMGERTPHLDATARGGWIGLTNSHTRADLIRALVEGVSYSQRDCLDIIEALGVAVNSVRASGGGAQEPVLAAIAGEHSRQTHRHAGDAGRIGIWRGAAGRGRYGRICFRSRSLPHGHSGNGIGVAGHSRCCILCESAPRVSGGLSGAEANLRPDRCAVAARR